MNILKRLSIDSMKFHPGTLVATKAIAERLENDRVFTQFVHKSIRRHLNCDWGNLNKEDAAMNDMAFKHGESRLFSVYEYSSSEKIWIITEWDRSSTTVLFPSDY